jgi:outer membrane protein TolC
MMFFPARIGKLVVWRSRLTIVPALLFLGSCIVTPEILTTSDLKNSAENDLKLMFGGEEKLIGSLSLEEAVARALKYNLDRRARSMERALALNLLDLDNFQLLPKLGASDTYSDRTEFSATNSKSDPNGPAPSSTYSYSGDRAGHTRDLKLSWNVLDFGVSFYNARQNADRSLIAEENRRKVVNNLVREVQFSYWRMVAAQKLEPRVKVAIAKAEQALVNARKVETEKLKNPSEILRFQKQLLQKISRIESVQQSLSSAHIELAALINVPPSTKFRVVPPPTDALILPKWSIGLEKMERIAFVNHPDIREKLYLSRISVDNAKKSLLAFLPGLDLSVGKKYDSNSFMDINRWYQWSSTISVKLLKLLAVPDQLKYNKASKTLSDAQRIALRMAVLAQVHVADVNYFNALKQYDRANDLYQIDERLTSQVSERQESDMQSVLDRISQETAAIVSVMRRYQTYSEVVGAVGTLYATLGKRVLDGGVHSTDLKNLSRTVGEILQARMNGGSFELEKKLTESVVKKNSVVFSSQLEQDRLAKLEQDRLAKLEQDRLAKLEQDRLAKLEQNRLAKLKQERIAKLKRKKIALVNKMKEENGALDYKLKELKIALDNKFQQEKSALDDKLRQEKESLENSITREGGGANKSFFDELDFTNRGFSLNAELRRSLVKPVNIKALPGSDMADANLSSKGVAKVSDLSRKAHKLNIKQKTTLLRMSDVESTKILLKESPGEGELLTIKVLCYSVSPLTVENGWVKIEAKDLDLKPVNGWLRLVYLNKFMATCKNIAANQKVQQIKVKGDSAELEIIDNQKNENEKETQVGVISLNKVRMLHQGDKLENRSGEITSVDISLNENLAGGRIAKSRILCGSVAKIKEKKEWVKIQAKALSSEAVVGWLHIIYLQKFQIQCKNLSSSKVSS